MNGPISNDEMKDRFHYHKPSDEGVERHAELASEFTRIALEVREIVPAGREQSLALTKLEEAKFWASAGVARNSTTR